MQRASGVYRDSFGRPVSGASVIVYLTGTQTLASIYAASGDPIAPPAQTNPFTTGPDGSWSFAAPNGRYDFSVSSTVAATQNYPNVFLSDAGGPFLANPMTAQGDMIGGGLAGAVTRIPGNATATVMYMSEANGAIPSFKQVAATEISGLAAFIAANGVSSFNGRIGAVLPAANDYGFSQLSGAASSSQIATALTTPGPVGGTTPNTVQGTTITATTQFTGPGTGLTGTAASLTAGTVTTNANLTGDVASVGNATTLATTQPGAHTWNGAQTFSNYLAVSAGEGIRVINDNGFNSFYNSAGTARSGYLQISTTGATLATDPATPINFSVNGGIKASLSSVGVWSLTAGIASTAYNNGTAVITGGLGVSGNIFSNAGIRSQLAGSTPGVAVDYGANTTFGTMGFLESGAIKAQISHFGANAGLGARNNTLELSAVGGDVTIVDNSGTRLFGFLNSGAMTVAGTATATEFIGPVTALKSATTSVDVSAAAAPISGQVITATGSGTATWQFPVGGPGGPYNRIVNGSFYQGLGPWVTSGATAPVYSATTATSGTSGSAAMVATAGVAHVTSVGSISEVFSIATPGGTLTLTYKTACYYSAAAPGGNTGIVRVYIYNASTGAETLVATNSLTASSTSPSFTNQSVTVTSNITAAGEWGVRFELTADTDNSGGSGTKTTTTLLDDVVLVI